MQIFFESTKHWKRKEKDWLDKTNKNRQKYLKFSSSNHGNRKHYKGHPASIHSEALQLRR